MDTYSSGFGRNLRALAGLHDLSGTDLAAVLGISRPAVSALLTGKNQPSLQTLLRVREVFGVGSELVSDPLPDLLPQLADSDRYLATLERLAKMEPRATQPARRAKVELAALRGGRVVPLQPSTKRGKR